MGECSGLGGVGFLPPLHQQRVRGIFDLLDLDLFVVHSHGGQRTRHLLLWAGGTGRTISKAQAHPAAPTQPPGQLGLSEPPWGQTAAGSACPTANSSSPLLSTEPAHSHRARISQGCGGKAEAAGPQTAPRAQSVSVAVERGFTFTSSHRSFSSFSTRLVCSGVGGTCMDCCQESGVASAGSCRNPIPSPAPSSSPSHPAAPSTSRSP